MDDNTQNPPGSAPEATDLPPLDEERSNAAQRWYEVRVCIGFLTRIPVFSQEFAGRTSLAAASWAFPVAGLVIGIVGALAMGIADSLGLGSELSALFALAAIILLTGALHEDGLADTADGLGLTNGDKERRLAAMHDAAIGVFGMLALILVFGARWAALADMVAPSLAEAAEVLIAAATISRGMLPYVMFAVPHARSDGLSVSAGRPDAQAAWVALGLSAVVALIVFGFGGAIIVLAIAAVVTYGVVAAARRMIGGQTGDVLGAIQQLVDAIILITAAGLLA